MRRWLAPALLVVAATGPAATSVAAEIGTAGATLPFVEYEAEDAQADGTPVGPDRRFGALASEASGRRAVRLDRPGQSVTITLTGATNALTIRYALPDSADGKGLSSQLTLKVAGEPLATMPITSRFGWFYGRYPFTNRSADGLAHHFWDEARVLLPRTLLAGSRIAVTQEPASAPWVAIDLVDAELVQRPLPATVGAVSIAEFGADPTGRSSSKSAITKAIQSAKRSGRPLFIPPGLYRINGHLLVDRIAISGAGPWYSVLTGSGLGFYARRDGSADVSLSSFAIESDVAERRDHRPLAAIGGTFSRSAFSDLFLHHAKVGVWLDGPATAIVLRRLRITDQTADGINLHRGISDALVEQNFVRNVGDDGIALWSDHVPDATIAIRNNSVVLPLLANGIAIYGGRDIVVRDNLVTDTITQGGGLHLGARFRSAPFSGSIDLSGNVLVRTGSFDPNWRFGIGALWIYALDQPIDGAQITVRDTLAIDSSCEALQLLGPNSISSVRIDRFQAVRSGDDIAAIQSPGSITIARASSSGRSAPDVVQLPDGFVLNDGGGNQGWSSARHAHPSPPACDAIQSALATYPPAPAHASAPP